MRRAVGIQVLSQGRTVSADDKVGGRAGRLFTAAKKRCTRTCYNLKTVRAYLLKEAFQQLWDYNSPAWAGKFLDDWCRQTMRSRINPMKKIARSLRTHRELILNYFRARKPDQPQNARPAAAAGEDMQQISLLYMKSILVRLDDPTYRALNQVVPTASRRRAEFIRTAIQQAIRQAEYDRARRAYSAKPDSEAEADDWSTCEEFKG